MKKSLLLILLLALGQSSCSYMTSRGRQQAAYARYVRKCSKGRVKLQHKFFAAGPKIPRSNATEPVTTTATDESGPQSMTAATASADSPSP